MEAYTVLTIYPRQVSTEIGLVREDVVIFYKEIPHDAEALEREAFFADQEEIRTGDIIKALEEAPVSLAEISAVSGYGLGLYPVRGGTYLIDAAVRKHAFKDIPKTRLPGVLGILIGSAIGKKLGVPAYTVDPTPTDELEDWARITGIPGIWHESHADLLCDRYAAIRCCREQKLNYKQSSFVILHLSKCITVSALSEGRFIDCSRSDYGQGPLSPGCCGDFYAEDVLNTMENGMSEQDCRVYCSRKGGLNAWCGTDRPEKVRDMIMKGDKIAAFAYDSMIRSIGKWTAMMAGALKGKADAVLVTGDLAGDRLLAEAVHEYISWIAPVFYYPGRLEAEALGDGVLRVLKGQEQALTYSGRPEWKGFRF